jgi:hypothetical protein
MSQPIAIVIAGALIAGALLCLAACDESPKPKQSSRQSNEAASEVSEDAALLKDLGRAGAELERRLLKSVSIQDGLVLVRTTAGYFTYVLPTTAPWVISCGAGLSVTFGTAVSGEASSDGNEVEIHVGNDVQIHLIVAPVDPDACAVLAPQLGQRLKAMMQETRNPATPR